jgi:hypothetical protein
MYNHTGHSLSSGSLVIIRRRFDIFAEVIKTFSVLYFTQYKGTDFMSKWRDEKNFSAYCCVENSI